jgi:hypothetical protein
MILRQWTTTHENEKRTITNDVETIEENEKGTTTNDIETRNGNV